jgi:uncharacterized protein YceH (UPF0502 family)
MVTRVDTLHAVEVRVLGALIEKDITTPEYYPLTVNSLQNACNQKSSRDPVVHFDEQTVEQALETLKNKHLVVRISGAGHRVEKWSHRLGEVLNLGRREMALLCVLMLRGPQTVGELRGRTERMHDFNDLEEVERVLETLEKSELVARASRGRWAQLLGGAVEVEDIPSVAVVRTPLEERVATLERELQRLKEQLEEKLGERFD